MSGVVELKAPILSNALKQPFSTTGMLSSLMAKCESKAHELNDLTGGLETLLDACPQYEGLFLIKCAPQQPCPPFCVEAGCGLFESANGYALQGDASCIGPVEPASEGGVNAEHAGGP